MLGSAVVHGLARASRRVPGLRRVPAVMLLGIGEVVLLAREHLGKLSPAERRRLLELVRLGRGRRGNLTPAQRTELADLIEKAEGRLFLGSAVSQLVPLPIPRRLVKALAKR